VESTPCFVLVEAQEGVCPSLNQLGPGSLCAYTADTDGQCDANGKCEKCQDIVGCLVYGDECKCLQCSDEYALSNGACACKDFDEVAADFCIVGDTDSYCSEAAARCKSCGGTWTITHDFGIFQDVYTCGGDNFCKILNGGSWVASSTTDDGKIWHGCGGDGYCKKQYGGGEWTIIWKVTDNHYGCGGNDYCNARYGTGEWTSTVKYSDDDYAYGCAGNSWCQSKYGNASTWKAPSKENMEGGCYTNGVLDGAPDSYINN